MAFLGSNVPDNAAFRETELPKEKHEKNAAAGKNMPGVWLAFFLEKEVGKKLE
jgi:hypothetical protein